jgi:phosphonate degradation associated HDIG domain protein
MNDRISEIIQLFGTKGADYYGSESITQLDHALQCAYFADQARASVELISACLLHDLGHLVSDRPHEIGQDHDDVHQFLALPLLREIFNDAVLEPIRLHVDAKRYLCLTEPGYWSLLSPASKHSLEVQGGIYSAEEAKNFIVQPYAEDAVRLRRWDDRAKVPKAAVLPLAYYLPILSAASVHFRD